MVYLYVCPYFETDGCYEWHSQAGVRNVVRTETRTVLENGRASGNVDWSVTESENVIATVCCARAGVEQGVEEARHTGRPCRIRRGLCRGTGGRNKPLFSKSETDIFVEIDIYQLTMCKMLGIGIALTLDILGVHIKKFGEELDGRFGAYVDGFH
jgi:hypothetical protein